MQNRGLGGLYRTLRGIYQPAVWDGVNRSGWAPIGDKVLVKPDKGAEKSAGGIMITETEQELSGLAAEAGVIVSMGTVAFSWADRERTCRWEGERPKVGDRVSFQRYAGIQIPGADGELYMSMNDYCIGAVLAAPGVAEIDTAKIAETFKKNSKRATA